MSEEQVKPDTSERKFDKFAVAAGILLIIGVVGVLLEWLVPSGTFLCISFAFVPIAVILGFVGLYRIVKSKGRSKGTAFAIMGMSSPLLVIVVLIIALFEVPKLSSRIICGSNMSALGKAIMVYADDNDGKFPTPQKWCDLLVVNEPNIIKLFTFCCKSDIGWEHGESSFAMNQNLKDKRIMDMYVPRDVVVLFETDYGNDENGQVVLCAERNGIEPNSFYASREVRKDKWNQHGGPELLTLDRHNREGSNILFADGHVEWIKAEDVRKLNWGMGVEKAEVKLEVGDEAPGFGLLDQDGKMVRLSDFAGTKLLVYFYPKAGTPGCTKQACSVRDSAEELKKAGVVPLGISPDEPNEQRQFDKEYSLGFRLLSDEDHKTAEQYGVWSEKQIGGKKIGGINRSSFLIDEKGKLIGVWYNIRPEDTVPKAVEALK